MQSDNRPVRLDNKSPETIANFAAILMAMPENVRLDFVLAKITTIEDLIKLKEVSTEVYNWMFTFHVVSRWERKYLFNNDYWRSYIMQRFAFQDFCTVAISNYEHATVRFDGRFQATNAVELSEMLVSFELAESLMTHFELHLMLQPTLQSTMILAFQEFFKINLKRILKNMELTGDLQYVKSNVFCISSANHIDIVMLIEHNNKRRAFDFLCFLMKKFETAYFPNWLQNEDVMDDADDMEESSNWTLEKIRAKSLN